MAKLGVKQTKNGPYSPKSWSRAWEWGCFPEIFAEKRLRLKNFTNFKNHLWSTWGAQSTRTLSWKFSGLVIFLSHVFYGIHSLHGSGSVWNFKWCYTDILENSEIVPYRQRRRFGSQFQYDSKLTPRNSKVQKPAPQTQILKLFIQLYRGLSFGATWNA